MPNCNPKNDLQQDSTCLAPSDKLWLTLQGGN